MIEQNILDILIHKIKDKCINPNTNKEYTIDDIKSEEYKTEVTNILNSETIIKTSIKMKKKKS